MSKDVTMLNLECINKECLLRLRVGRILNKPATIVGGFKFCPLCGGPAGSHLDSDEDYMETLSKAYEVPVEVVKMLLNTWNTNEYQRFSDHVAQIKREVDESIGIPV